MAERKSTPDVLGEILGSLTPPDPAIPPQASPPLGLSLGTKPAPPSTPKRRQAPAEPAPPPAPEVKAPVKFPSPLFPKPEPPRPQWEYLRLVFRDYDGWRPYARNGQEIASWKQGPGIDVYLAQLGGEGWELAGVATGEHGQLHAFFKRTKRA